MEKKDKVLVCTPYITKNGKRIYAKNASKKFCFYVEADKVKNR